MVPRREATANDLGGSREAVGSGARTCEHLRRAFLASPARTSANKEPPPRRLDPQPNDTESIRLASLSRADLRVFSRESDHGEIASPAQTEIVDLRDILARTIVEAAEDDEIEGFHDDAKIEPQTPSIHVF